MLRDVKSPVLIVTEASRDNSVPSKTTAAEAAPAAPTTSANEETATAAPRKKFFFENKTKVLSIDRFGEGRATLRNLSEPALLLFFVVSDERTCGPSVLVAATLPADYHTVECLAPNCYQTDAQCPICN
jgi:hypothetical protein